MAIRLDQVEEALNEGKLTLAFNGVAEGMLNASADCAGTSVTVNTLSTSGYGQAIAGSLKTVATVEGERVLALVNLRGLAGATAVTRYAQILVDGIPIGGSNRWWLGNTSGDYSQMVTFCIPVGPLTAGAHTLQLAVAKHTGDPDWECFWDVSYIQYRGGYVQPENTPTLVFNTTTVVTVAAVPGASAALALTFNDGKRYVATAPLTVDLTINGRGGLDTGSKTNNTWYYVYAVPSLTPGRFSVVASATDPDSGGPTGFDISKFIGEVYVLSTGAIRDFIQYGDTTFYVNRQQCAVSAAFGTALQDPAVNVDLSDVVPRTAGTMFGLCMIQNDAVIEAQLLYQVLYIFDRAALFFSHYIRCDTTRNAESWGYNIPIVLDAGVPKIKYRTYRSGGTIGINVQALYTMGYVNKHLQRQLTTPITDQYIPENIPVLEYSTVAVTNVVSGPGASSLLVAQLSDGVRRTYNGSLSVDLTVSGRGGIDTGSEAADTWYYLYLVPDVSGAGLAAVASITPPTTGGPTGFSAWKYIGSVRNNSSSNIISFLQVKNAISYMVEYGVVYTGNGAGYIENEGAFVAVDISAYVPATARRMEWDNYCNIAAENPQGAWTIYWSTNGTQSLNYMFCRGDVSVQQIAQKVFSFPVPANRIIYRRRARTAGALNLAWISYGLRMYVDAYLTGV